jgi:hypothetical protein
MATARSAPSDTTSGTARGAAGGAAGFSATGVDFKKALKPFFNPPRRPVMVDVPELGYLMIDGRGAPEESENEPSPEFQQSFSALFPVVYTIKFRLKKDGLTMPILPLEALWMTSDDGSFSMTVPPAEWRWRVMIAVSDDVTPAVFEDAVAEVRRKKGENQYLARLRFERWREGRCAQVMHVGPYSEERATIERLHAFIAAEGCRARGAHHEIYLGDPRRGDPSKLKTVLRQPVD